jgi:hypothetical protein
VKVNQRSGRIYRLHLQGIRILTARNQNEACRNVVLLLGLFLDPEYGGDIFLRNFD